MFSYKLYLRVKVLSVTDCCEQAKIVPYGWKVCTHRTFAISLSASSPPPLLRTTVIVHNRFPQENVNVYKSCKNQHDYLIMCCVHSNDQIIDFLYTKIMKIDEK